MERKIIKIVRRWFNEIVGGYHLPYFAEVVAVAKPRANAIDCDAFNPHYSVDVQILDARLRPDKNFPVFTSLPIPIPAGGDHRGWLGLPQKGTVVELAFARGLPSQPFIRTVLAEGLTVPGIETDEMRWNHSEPVYQRADKDGNWERTTENDIKDNADNLIERIEKIADRLAKEKQLLKVEDGGRVWVGNQSTNVLTLLSDLMAVVTSLAGHVAAHKHAGVMSGSSTTAAPDNASSITTDGNDSSTLKSTLDPIKE